MKQFLFGVLVMSYCVSARAQQDYFIFIQDISREPFYARLGDESHSSSAGGHLILASLKDSVYNVFVGFPGDRQPEQLFTVAMGARDRGFELQRHGTGWQLFDLQALAVIKPAPVGGREGRPVKKEDAYSRLMAGVVDDTTVLYTYETATPAAAAPAAKTAVTPPATAPAAKTAVTPHATAPAAKTAAPAPATPAEKNAATPPATAPVATASPAPSNRPAALDSPRRPQPATSETATAATVAREAAPAAAAPAGLENTATPNTQPAGPILDSRDIIRYRTENQVEGKLFIYVDRSIAVPDTIRIIIPRL